MPFCRHWFFCLLILSTTVSAADKYIPVYKWTDAEGNTHYAEAPSPEFQSIKIKFLDEDFKVLLAAKIRSLNAVEMTQEQRVKCKEATTMFEKFSDTFYYKFTKVDENGETRFLTPEELKEKTAEAKQSMQELCHLPQQ